MIYLYHARVDFFHITVNMETIWSSLTQHRRYIVFEIERVQTWLHRCCIGVAYVV